MKYFLVSVVILLLGCSMPGVGDLEERVDDLEDTTVYDDSDLVVQMDNLEDDVEIIDERVNVLETGGISASGDVLEPNGHRSNETEEPIEKIELSIEDIAGLQDSMDVMKTGLSDSITVLDESLENLVLSVDSLTMENDSLKVELEDLQDQIQSLSYTVENMRYTGTTSTSTRGSSSSGTGGRGGSTGSGTSGGTSGGTR